MCDPCKNCCAVDVQCVSCQVKLSCCATAQPWFNPAISCGCCGCIESCKCLQYGFCTDKGGDCAEECGCAGGEDEYPRVRHCAIAMSTFALRAETVPLVLTRPLVRRTVWLQLLLRVGGCVRRRARHRVHTSSVLWKARSGTRSSGITEAGARDGALKW